MRKHIFVSFVVLIFVLIALLFMPAQTLGQRYRAGHPVYHAGYHVAPGYYGLHAYYPRTTYYPYGSVYRYPAYRYPAYRYPVYRYPVYRYPLYRYPVYYSQLYVYPVYSYPAYSYYNDYVSPPSTAYVPSYSYSPSASAATMTAAVIELRLPAANTEVWIEGIKTTEVGTVRTFVSPALPAGVEYTYQIRAKWIEGGRTIDQTRAVPVRAGEHTMVDFAVAAIETPPRPAGE